MRSVASPCASISAPILPSLSCLPVPQQELDFRLLGLADAQAVMHLRAQVLAQLSHPDLYVREADEAQFVRRHLQAQAPPDLQSWGASIGVFDGSKLVAYAMLGMPAATDPDNLAHHAGAAVADPESTAHLASCMVLPDYQGRHLQRSLLYIRCALARAWGRESILAMVSLHNHASRHNLMSEGLCVSWLGEIDGLRRQLLACKQTQPWYFDMRDMKKVSSLDWQSQQSLLADAWWGVRSVREPHGTSIFYARRLLERP